MIQHIVLHASHNASISQCGRIKGKSRPPAGFRILSLKDAVPTPTRTPLYLGGDTFGVGIDLPQSDTFMIVESAADQG
jgi:hypothetical protein